MYLPLGDCPVPLVLRGVCGDIDASRDAEIKQQIYEYHIGRASLGGMETIKHFTVVGECFVEGRMGYMNYSENETSHILALH